MFGRKNHRIHRNLVIVALLSGCVYFFGYSPVAVKHVVAAPCIQECENNKKECDDNCFDECSPEGSQSACYSCSQSCSQTYFQCLSYAISCEGITENPTRCSVHVGTICSDNTCAVSYSGYYMVCQDPEYMGGEACLNCAGTGYCGSNLDAPSLSCVGWF